MVDNPTASETNDPAPGQASGRLTALFALLMSLVAVMLAGADIFDVAGLEVKNVGREWFSLATAEPTEAAPPRGK